MLRRIEGEREICEYMHIQCLLLKKMQGTIQRSIHFLRGEILSLAKTHKLSGRRNGVC